MRKPVPAPRSFQDIIGRIIEYSWLWFGRRSILSKCGLILGVAGLGFLLARAGVFGDQYRVISQIVFPYRVFGVDEVPVVQFFELKGDEISSSKDRPCRTGSDVELSYATSGDAYSLIVNVDSLGVHPLGARSGADKIAAKETYKTTIRLNDVIGTELFYVIASVQNFNFEDVRPAFDKVRIDRRGPDMRLDVKLPPYMISRYQFCMHDR